MDKKLSECSIAELELEIRSRESVKGRLYQMPIVFRKGDEDILVVLLDVKNKTKLIKDALRSWLQLGERE